MAGARTFVIVPMLKDNELIGAIGIYRQEVRPFSDKQIELVTNFAKQGVIAIENTRLLSELRESLQQQTATADVLKVISRSTFDLQTVLDTLVESAARLCGAEMANIWRPRDGAYRLTASYGVTARYKESLENKEFLNTIAIEPGRGTTVGRVLLERKSVHIHDIQADPDYKLSGLVALGGTRTMLGIPMLREGDPIGVLVLVQSAVRPFTDKQIELATTFADQAVIAIENVRLFEEVQARTRDLSESLEQQTATSEVLQVISSSAGELKPVFETMLESAVRICGAKFGNLLLVEGDAFRHVALHGAPQAYLEERRREPVIRPRPGSDLDRIRSTKQIVHVADMQLEGPATAAIVELAGARTFLNVPMLKDNELIGTIGIYRQEVRPFTDKQIELVKNFAAQAVIAIENARLLNELRQRTDDLTESLEQQTATSEVLRIISSSPGDLEPVFEAMLQNSVRICEAGFGQMFLCEGDNVRLVAAVGVPTVLVEFDKQRGTFQPSPGGGLDGVMRTKQVVHIADLLSEHASYPPTRLGGARSYIAVPMLKENKLVGAIAIYRQEVRPFTDKQIDLVKNFAAQAVIAIENTRLLNELRQRTADLSKSLEELRTTQDRLVQTQKLALLGQLTAGIA
ncbi:MAG: GAF domain-containing protein, partial [Pseudolabrys sp.]